METNERGIRVLTWEEWTKMVEGIPDYDDTNDPVEPFVPISYPLGFNERMDYLLRRVMDQVGDPE